jgi:hypothetical protein
VLLANIYRFPGFGNKDRKLNAAVGLCKKRI